MCLPSLMLTGREKLSERDHWTTSNSSLRARWRKILPPGLGGTHDFDVKRWRGDSAMTTPEARNVYQRLAHKIWRLSGIATRRRGVDRNRLVSFRDPGSMADAFDELTQFHGVGAEPGSRGAELNIGPTLWATTSPLTLISHRVFIDGVTRDSV
jgi:hypothetical protein